MALSAGLFVVSTSASFNPSQGMLAEPSQDHAASQLATATPSPESLRPLVIECSKPLRHALPPNGSATWQMDGEPGDVLSIHYLGASQGSNSLINLQLNDENLLQASSGGNPSEVQSFLLPTQAIYTLTIVSDEMGLEYDIELACGGVQTVQSPTLTITPISEPTPIPKSDSLSSRAAEITATGDLVVYLLWQSVVDLDLHVIDPRGEEIYFENPRSMTGGILEYEANASCLTAINKPQESIFWKADTAPSGEYQVVVDYYGSCEDEGAQDFLIGVWINGELAQLVEGTIEPESQQIVFEFSY